MQKLGLMDVDVRMNDKVEFITPQLADYEERKNDFIRYNDWNAGISQEKKEQMIRRLLTHGLSRKEAEEYCGRNVKIAEYFTTHPNTGYTFTKGQMISYGKKAAASD